MLKSRCLYLHKQRLFKRLQLFVKIIVLEVYPKNQLYMYAKCVRICTKADTFENIVLANMLLINKLYLWHEVRNVSSK